MKKRVLCVALATTMMFAFTGCGKKEEPANTAPAEQQEDELTAVQTMVISKSNISNTSSYSGTVQPVKTVNVTVPTQGDVMSLNYDVGDKVEKGAVLFTMDTSDLNDSLKSARAQLESANAGVATAQTNLEFANGSAIQTQIENSKNAVTNAQRALENAQTGFDNAKTDYETNQALFTAGGVSQDMLNKSKDAYDRAQRTLNQAQDAYNQAKTTYDILVNQTTAENTKKAQNALNSAKASQKSAQVAVEMAQKKLNDASAESPISGTVLTNNLTLGASASMGTVAFTIIDTSVVNIEVNVAAQIVGSIKEGDSVKITTPDFISESFEGKITSIAPGGNADGTYTVKIEIQNADDKLKSGAFAQVEFVKENSNDTISIPRDACITKGDEKYVFVVENSIAKKVDVQTGIDSGENIEIVSGLKEGDTIVIQGQTYLKDGEKVNDVTNNKAFDEQETTNNEDESINNTTQEQ